MKVFSVICALFMAAVCVSAAPYTKPANAVGKPVWSTTLRGEVVLFAYAAPDAPAVLDFDIIYTRWGYNIPVTVTAPDGKAAQGFTINAKRFTYVFETANAGVYTFRFKTLCAIKVRAFSAGWGIDCSRRLGMMGQSRVDTMYLCIPGGSSGISLHLTGEGQEKVGCELFDHNGKKVGELPYTAGDRILDAPATASEKDEFYQLKIRGQEDHAMDLMTPEHKIIYTDPANALK